MLQVRGSWERGQLEGASEEVMTCAQVAVAMRVRAKRTKRRLELDQSWERQVSARIGLRLEVFQGCRFFCFLQLNYLHGMTWLTDFTVDSSERPLFSQMLLADTLVSTLPRFLLAQLYVLDAVISIVLVFL